MGKHLFLILISLLSGVLHEGPTRASGNVVTQAAKCAYMDSFWDDGLSLCLECSDVCKNEGVESKTLCRDKCSDYLRMQRIQEMIRASQDTLVAKMGITSQPPTEKMTAFQIVSIVFYALASLLLIVLTVVGFFLFRIGRRVYNQSKSASFTLERLRQQMNTPHGNKQSGENLSETEYETYSDVTERRNLLKRDSITVVPGSEKVPLHISSIQEPQRDSGFDSRSTSGNLPSHISIRSNTHAKPLREVQREVEYDMAAAKLNPQPQSHEPAEGGTRTTGSLRRNAPRHQSLPSEAPYAMGTLPSSTYLYSPAPVDMTSRQSGNTRIIGGNNEPPPSRQTVDVRRDSSLSLDGASIPYGNVPNGVPNGVGDWLFDSSRDAVVTNGMGSPTSGVAAPDTRPFANAPPVAVSAVGNDSRFQQPADDATYGAFTDFDDDTGMYTFLNGPQLPKELEDIFDESPFYALSTFDATDRLVIYVYRDTLDEAKRVLEPQVKQYWKRGFQILPEP